MSPTAICVDPLDHQRLWIAGFDGVWRSSCGEGCWVSVNDGMNGNGVLGDLSSIVINPQRSSALIVGGSSYEPRFNGIWRSDDTGATWTRVALDSIAIYALAFDPTDTSRVFAGTNGRGLFASDDGGFTWHATEVDSEGVRAITFAPGSGAFAAAGRRSSARRAEASSLSPGLTIGTNTRGVLAVSIPQTSVENGVASPRFGLRCVNGRTRTEIRLSPPESSEPVNVAIMDISGRLVAELYRGPAPRASLDLVWTWRTHSGADASSGVYFVFARAGRQVATARAIVIR